MDRARDAGVLLAGGLLALGLLASGLACSAMDRAGGSGGGAAAESSSGGGGHGGGGHGGGGHGGSCTAELDGDPLNCGACGHRCTPGQVEPGAPHESYLMDKLLDVRLCLGGPMPPSKPLPDGQVRTISDWICAGAKSE